MPRTLLVPLLFATACAGTTAIPDVCSCDNSSTLGVCDEVLPLVDRASASGACGPVMQACNATGGTYGEVACPTDDAVGACFDDQSTDADKPGQTRRVYYALGDMPFDATSAEDDCDDEEQFQTSW